MKNWIHDNHSDIILNSKVKLYRNLKNLSFPNKLNSIVAIEKSRSIYDILVKEIEHNDLELYEVWNGKKEFYNEYIENNCIFNLDNLEILDEGLNCDVCCAYTLIEEIRNKIKGYVDSVIVLSKINSFVYKIDANMEQIDIITKMSYETNMQCIITIYNDH